MTRYIANSPETDKRNQPGPLPMQAQQAFQASGRRDTAINLRALTATALSAFITHKHITALILTQGFEFLIGSTALKGMARHVGSLSIRYGHA